jgi:hypothetical protein
MCQNKNKNKIFFYFILKTKQTKIKKKIKWAPDFARRWREQLTHLPAARRGEGMSGEDHVLKCLKCPLIKT